MLANLIDKYTLFMTLQGFIAGILCAYIMTKAEYPNRFNWWLNELESLGVSMNTKDACNNIKEASELTEEVKQIFYEEYQRTYSENNG
jgi:hypothetical protein